MMVLITASISTMAQPLMVSKAVTHTTYGSGDGAISLTIDSGQSPFHYLWSTSDTTATVSGLVAGVYSVTVIDANDTVVLETEVSTYAVWDIMQRVLETTEHVVTTDGSPEDVDGDVPWGLGFAGNVLLPDSSGSISFDFLPDSSFGGIIGLMNNGMASAPMIDYVLPVILPDSVGNLFLVTDFNNGDIVFIGNWDKQEPLQLKVALTKDSVYLRKNGIEVYNYAYTRTTPIYPVFYPMMENSKVDAVTCNFKPLMPPVAPASQTACSDTAYTFHFDSVLVGSGGDSIEWSLNSGFVGGAVCASPSPTGEVGIHASVNIGSTDTLWLRSKASTTGFVSRTVFTTAKVNLKPDAPMPPAPKAVNSDTAYHFVFVNLNPGYGGNQLEWSLDSTFSVSTLMTCFDTTLNGKDTSSCTINVTVPPLSDTLIWMRCMDTITGCVSETRGTIAIVAHVPQRQPITVDSIVVICVGSATNIKIPGTVHSKRYDLIADSGRVAMSMGNDTTLYLSTGNVYTNTFLTIIATDTASGDTTHLNTAVLINTLNAVDSIVYIEGDTLVYKNDTVLYHASAMNGIRAVYSLVSGSATVDSLTGAVSNMTGSSFTMRATMHGATSCGTATGDLHVHVTHVAPPIVPAYKTVYLDTPVLVTITLDSIFAGDGGDEIEWAVNDSFASSTIVASPVVISIDLAPGRDTTFWVRTVDSKTGKHSQHRKTGARSASVALSAGLLDKSKWVLNAGLSDEFDWPGLLPYNNNNNTFPIPNFKDKWALNFCWDGACSPANCETHANYNSKGELQLFNYDNLDGSHTDGYDEQVSFDGNYAHIKATRLPDSVTPLTPAACTSVWSQNHIPYAQRDIYYKSGELVSKEVFDLSNPGMFEIRCQVPTGEGAWPAFWFIAPDKGTELDIMEGPFEGNTREIGTATIWDYSPEAINAYGTVIVPIVSGTGSAQSDFITVQSTSQGAVTISEGMAVTGTGIGADARVKSISGNLIELTVENTTNVTGNITFKLSQISCTRIMRKETPCLYTDDFHTYTCVVTNDEIFFFEDGKEVWSEKRNSPNGSTAYPFNLHGAARLSFGIGVRGILSSTKPGFYEPGSNYPDEYELLVDYVRSYTPASNPTNECLQNLESGAAKTVESLNANEQQDLPYLPNNDALAITNTLTLKTHQIPFSKIAHSNEPGLKKIFYKGTDYKCYAAYYDGSHWLEYALRDDITDVMGEITTDDKRVYYLGNGNEIKYFQWMANLGNPDQTGHPKYEWVNYGTGIYSFGSFNIDAMGRLFYIDVTHNISVLPPTGSFLGNEIQITNTGDVCCGLTVQSSGVLMFYEDINENLVERVWYGGGTTAGVIPNATAAPLMALDEDRYRLYYKDKNDNDIHLCEYNFPQLNQVRLKKLGTSATCDDNNKVFYSPYFTTGTQAIANFIYPSGLLTLSHDKNMLFYQGQDQHIWYYHSDHDKKNRENWYKTPVNYYKQSAGPMTIEPWDNGRLYYVGEEDSRLHKIDWIDADNPVDCPTDNWGEIASYKTDGAEVAVPTIDTATKAIKNNKTIEPKTKTMQVSVYPNPSFNQFSIYIEGLANETDLDLRIQSIDGRIVYTSFTTANTKAGFVWDAAKMNSGVYYYSIKTSTGEKLSGRMTKM